MKCSFRNSASIAALAAAMALVTPSAANAQAVDWSGFYVGLHLGGANADVNGQYFREPAGPTSSTVLFDKLNMSGIAGGIHGGYNWDFGTLIAGVELDITGMDLDDRAGAPSSSEEVRVKIDMLATIRARLGIAVGQEREVLLFATGGAAFAKGRTDAFFTNPPGGIGDRAGYSDIGGVFGGGVEWAPPGQVSFRVEGLYYIFDDRTALRGPGSSPGDFTELNDAWVLRAGLTWHLNGLRERGGIEPAADLTTVTNWGGVYAGLHLGGGAAAVTGAYLNDMRFQRVEPGGLAGGVQLGYNFDQGMFVLGVEGDITGTGWQDYEDADNSSEAANVDIDFLATIRGRVGVPIGQDRKSMLFATGGLAFVNGSAKIFSNTDSATAPNESFKFNNLGAVVGAGYEWAATDSIRVRLDGLYYLFDEKKNITVGGPNAGDFVKLNNAWVIRTGINWHFGGPAM